MNYGRAIASGTIVWICVVITFYILEHTPIVKESLSLQTVFISVLIICYAWIGGVFYYKNGAKTKGVLVGIMMSATAVLLDALLFAPLIEIPKGNTYQEFFSNPLLWTLSSINAITVFVYWKLTVASKQI